MKDADNDHHVARLPEVNEMRPAGDYTVSLTDMVRIAAEILTGTLPIQYVPKPFNIRDRLVFTPVIQ